VPKGTLLCASFKSRQILAALRSRLFGGRRVVCALAPGSLKDMLEVASLVEAGVLKPIVDRIFPLEQAAEAHRYVESGAKRGAVVIRLDPGAEAFAEYTTARESLLAPKPSGRVGRRA
jgi:NADPH:quinone reductase-like Zn-dependent oxidoreductase